MKTQKLRELALDATQGEWVHRKHLRNPDLGFVEAPRAEKMAYALEVLGDDYTGYGDEAQRQNDCAYIAFACPANILALIDSHAELLRKAKQYAENWLLDERDDHDREICICDEHYRHIQELFAAITKAEAL